MATAKTLQKPKILNIEGSLIRIQHPDISGNLKTALAAPITAAGTACTLYDNTGLADDDWLLFGNIGDSQTETADINGAVTIGQSITLTNNLTFGHSIDCPVTKISERGIKIYGASTDGGSGTLIASIDAFAASGKQLGDAKMIEWHRPYTEYRLISTDTTYSYYYVKFTDGTTDSSASDYIASTGHASNSVYKMIKAALDMSGAEINDRITLPMCINWADEAQSAISQYTFLDDTGKMVQKDWDFEVTRSTVTSSVNKNKYDLSSLNLKHNYNKGIHAVQIGSKKPIDPIEWGDFLIKMDGNLYTEAVGGETAGTTTLTVDSNVEFADSGTLYVDGQTLTYTAKSGTTQFTGIPAAGTGSITATITADAGVWQNISPGLPERYVVFSGDLYFDVPLSSDYENYPIYITHLKKLTALTEISDTTEVTFYNIIPFYIAWMIEIKRKNMEAALSFKKYFDDKLLQNAKHEKVINDAPESYYNFEDPYSAFITY